MIIRKLYKVALLVFAILFQLAETAYASNSHNCCDDAAPCCIMMTSTKTCSPCILPGITGGQLCLSEEQDNGPGYSISSSYRSLNFHVIWRPPIE